MCRGFNSLPDHNPAFAGFFVCGQTSVFPRVRANPREEGFLPVVQLLPPFPVELPLPVATTTD